MLCCVCNAVYVVVAHSFVVAVAAAAAAAGTLDAKLTVVVNEPMKM